MGPKNLSGGFIGVQLTFSTYVRTSLSVLCAITSLAEACV